jgi:hypothetical protein
VEINTLLSANKIFKLIIDSPRIGLLLNKMANKPLQINKNKDRMNLLYNGISKLEIGS